jgi:N-acetyl-anhydromuramyl-L-alanine amidase AmpD
MSPHTLMPVFHEGSGFPTIPPGRVIGHSDIGLCYENSADCIKGPKRLGRKEYDPGSAFPWERVEALGLSLQIKDGTLKPEALSEGV